MPPDIPDRRKVREQLVGTDTPFARDLALSADPAQRFYVGDGDAVAIVDAPFSIVVSSTAAIGGGHRIATRLEGGIIARLPPACRSSCGGLGVTLSSPQRRQPGI